MYVKSFNNKYDMADWINNLIGLFNSYNFCKGWCGGITYQTQQTSLTTWCVIISD